MTELLKSDIFFFITSIATVIIAILVILVLIYILRIVSDVKYISRMLKNEGSGFFVEVKLLLVSAIREALRIVSIAGVVKKIIGSITSETKKTTKKRKTKPKSSKK